MTFLLAIALYVAAGLALLGLLRLGTGSRAADVALAWLVGTGWFAAAAPVLRFALGLPLRGATAAAIVLAPAAVWSVAWARRRRRGPAAAADPGAPRASGARWLPRPLWLFAPLAAYVALVALAVVLHGVNTPTYTDDGVRVRAFAPMLAFDDGWPPEARSVLSLAGPFPTFVPALAWIVTGRLDHFHVNYAVLAELLALLVLTTALLARRGDPERGWAGAFALLSIPLFVHHCTSTYSDAVLAMRVGGGLLFAIEYARTRERADAARALLLFGLAALVKREGELVAVAAGAVLVAQLAWERREGRAFPWGAAALLATPPLLGLAGKIAAAGLAGAAPMLSLVAQRAAVGAGAGGGRPAGTLAEAAGVFLGLALFRSGNQGMIYWILAAAVAVRGRALLRTRLLWPSIALAVLLAEVAISSILVIPEYTLDQSTVHRALLVVTVPAALWLAAAVTEAVREAIARGAWDAAEAAPPAVGGAGTATQRRRRPRRRESRR
jgi:hypothetical protein